MFNLIKLAKSAGFCFGVERAVNLAYSNASLSNIFTFGPIIHNDFVTNDLKLKGVEIAYELTPRIKNVIIRSHGVGENIYKQADHLGINIIDATCPYVKKIHNLVKQHIILGQSIIIIGDKLHPEIIGINGWTNDNAIIIKDEFDSNIPLLDNTKSYFVVAQTTYKQEVVNRIIQLLEENHITFNYVHTICSTTTKRQQEARSLAKNVDTMIIVGGRNSSNTKKLFEICLSECKNSLCIENASELAKIKFNKDSDIGITAGASTPKYIIDDVISYINNTIKGEISNGL